MCVAGLETGKKRKWNFRSGRGKREQYRKDTEMDGL